jgi:hypothetical protein
VLFPGYGHIAPTTPVGKLVTIFYAIFGIPLFLLYLSNIGDIMATTFKWIYSRLDTVQEFFRKLHMKPHKHLLMNKNSSTAPAKSSPKTNKRVLWIQTLKWPQVAAK